MVGFSYFCVVKGSHYHHVNKSDISSISNLSYCLALNRMKQKEEEEEEEKEGGRGRSRNNHSTIEITTYDRFFSPCRRNVSIAFSSIFRPFTALKLTPARLISTPSRQSVRRSFWSKMYCICMHTKTPQSEPFSCWGLLSRSMNFRDDDALSLLPLTFVAAGLSWGLLLSFLTAP